MYFIGYFDKKAGRRYERYGGRGQIKPATPGDI